MKKFVYGLLMLGWIPTLGVVTGARWIAGDAVAAQPRTPVTVTHLYTGADGKTKVEEFEIPLTPRDDTTGQGHISRAVPGKDRIALDLGLAERATLPRSK